jgi:aldose 1-epimerase
MSDGYLARIVPVDGLEVVELSDRAHALEVRIVPAVGNMAYEIKAGGSNVLWFPDGSPARLRENRTLSGVPFLAPWANRLDGDAYWVNGHQYRLNAALGNLRLDKAGLPIHGLLNFSSAWSLDAHQADDQSAWASSRLEFWRHPDLMAQFPFAHTVTMTYRLADGELAVETSIENLAAEPMPVAVGYHPFFHLHDAPRDQWRVHLPVRRHIAVDQRMIPTGERQPARYDDPQSLAGIQFDDGFSDLVRDSDGLARFWFEGRRQRLTVTYGPKFTVAVVFAPPGCDFLCFEPMAAATNAFNLTHAGVAAQLQSIPPGGEWRETFWIKPSGF